MICNFFPFSVKELDLHGLTRYTLDNPDASAYNAACGANTSLISDGPEAAAWARRE